MKTRVRQLSRKQVAAVSAQLAGSCAGVLRDHLQRLRRVGDHANRVLHYDQLLAGLLLGFYDSVVRSMRTLDVRSAAGGEMGAALDGLRLARSTTGDAMNELPAAALLPLMSELLARLPANCSHPDLQDLLTLKKRICAIDGSYFRVPADVLWALAHRRSNGKVARQVRLDLHLDVLRFVPTKAQVDGKDRGSESAAFIATLEGGVVYLADRNFVDFDFLRAVLAAGSDFVVRLKTGRNTAHVTVLDTNPLTGADAEAGVLRDERVALPGTRQTPGLADIPLRRVTVFDPVRREEVQLLTTLLDVPARLIGQLYRHRWLIEMHHPYCLPCHRLYHLDDGSCGRGLGRVSSAA